MEITFTKEKETKNTVRYSEDVSKGPPRVGTLYVQKWALRQINGGTYPNGVTRHNAIELLSGRHGDANAS